MKKEKIILALLCAVATIGGALAYKANRSFHTFYLDTITTQGGFPVSVCSVVTTYTLVENPAGFRTIKASSTPLGVTCPVISVVPSL